MTGKALRSSLLSLLLLTLSRGGLATRDAPSGGENFDFVGETVGTWVECSFDREPSQCLRERTIRQLRGMKENLETSLAEEARRVGKNLGEDSGEEGGGETRLLLRENEKMLKKIEENKSEPPSLLDEIGDFFAGGLLRLFDMFDFREEENGSTDGKESEDSEEGRGHKKKYLKKQNKHLKLILILMLIKNKVKMFLQKFQFLIQLKFLGIAVANLLINLIRLWLELKKKHKPNKVIYYEKSHHQHHYDNEHIHEDDDHHYGYPGSYSHHGHHEEEHDGGGIWPWSRSYVEKNGDFYVNAPLKFRRPDMASHNLVYMNQRPIR